MKSKSDKSSKKEKWVSFYPEYDPKCVNCHGSGMCYLKKEINGVDGVMSCPCGKVPTPSKSTVSTKDWQDILMENKPEENIILKKMKSNPSPSKSTVSTNKTKCKNCGWYKYAEWNKDGDYCQCPKSVSTKDWENKIASKLAVMAGNVMLASGYEESNLPLDLEINGKVTKVVMSTYDELEEIVHSPLTQARQEEKLHTIATIRNWMKGKNIDKEKMRQYLNKLRKEV
jgi:hypothetical protein